MSDGSGHVPIEELASGSLGAAAQQHLLVCAVCHNEAEEWAATRDAVGLIFADVDPPEGLVDEVLAGMDVESPLHPDLSRSAWRWWRAGRERRVRLAAAAAALLVLAGGVGYGITDLVRSPDRPVIQTAVTMVAGCSGLESVNGTLQSIEGSTLVIHAGHGTTIRVVAGPASHIDLQQTADMSMIQEGAPVVVTGTYSKGTLKAAHVGKLASVPAISSTVDIAKMLKQGQAVGTVAKVGPGGFTVAEPGGTRVTVVASRSTQVIATVPVDPSRLQTGARTAAVGSSGPGGVLVASAVDQQASPLHLVGPPSGAIPGPGRLPSGAERSRSPLEGLGCDPATIAPAALILPS
jgi:hypothetical protein